MQSHVYEGDGLHFNASAFIYSTMTQPSPAVTRAWIDLARAYGAIVSDIENALSRAKLPPLTWYDILLEVERAGEDGLRQNALEQALLLRQYNVSRLVERIEAAGLLARRPCPEDGRARRLFPTEAGRAMRRRIWAVYGHRLSALVGDALGDADCRALSALLTTLRGHAATVE